jgi:capsular exopolysaccharide synthesis family protein
MPTLELREVLRILGERYRIVLAVLAATLLLALAWSLLTTPQYRSTVLLQYDPSATDSLEQNRAPVLRPMVANQEVMATQVGLIRSEALAQRVAETLNLAANADYGGTGGSHEERVTRATRRVLGAIAVEPIKNALLLRVSVSARNPKLAARMASELAQAFIAISLERRYNATGYARKFLADQLAHTRIALEESERAVNDYAIRTNLFRTPGQIVDGKSSEGPTLSVTDLAAMEDALNQARVRRVAAESAWRAGASDRIPDNAGAIGPLIQQRSQLQAQYELNLRTFKPDYPAMQELAAQIARLNQAIGSERDLGRHDQSGQLLAAYKAALQTETDLAARVANAKSSVQDERVRSIQYNILRREADTNRVQYDALLQRFKDVTVSSSIGQSNIALVDDAKVARAPYRPNLVVNLLLGLIVGLLLGLGAAFVAHVLFDTISQPADVRTKLGLKVLGVVPVEVEAADSWQALDDRKSHLAEAYYSALTAIKFARAEGMPRSLFVTSSNAGEGKSTTSYAIALLSARLGRRVLLIDADLRRPTFIAQGGKTPPGLTHLLASDDLLASCVVETGHEGLSLLPVGAQGDAPAELLSSVRLPAILDEAMAAYDLVVLDGPPVLGLTDAPLLASVAESTIVVVESRRTRTSAALDMIRRVNEAGGCLLGVVLNKSARSRSGYGYSYRYDYASDGQARKDKVRVDLGMPMNHA